MWSELAVGGLAWPVVAVVLLSGALRLLAERSRRRTLVDVVTRAPRGTRITQDRGSFGPAFRVCVGPARHGDRGAGGERAPS
ncbi:hypothetical protein [Streptomyces kanasensis]|uniref:hypothetical protein n=1 Tax=Streptomyces kanasensis TaxID=936756 RepID=UPI0036F671FD